jgi:hypothetical protein
MGIWRKVIPLPPPARDILMRQPTRAREDRLLFVSKQGRRLSAPTMSQYWAVVKARAGLDFDIYEATKHYGVCRVSAAGVSKRTIAYMAGWSESAVDSLLKIYGHADVAARRRSMRSTPTSATRELSMPGLANRTIARYRQPARNSETLANVRRAG